MVVGGRYGGVPSGAIRLIAWSVLGKHPRDVHALRAGHLLSLALLPSRHHGNAVVVLVLLSPWLIGLIRHLVEWRTSQMGLKEALE